VKNRVETGNYLGRVQIEAGLFCPALGLAWRKRIKRSNMRKPLFLGLLRLFAAISLTAVVWIGLVAQTCGVKSQVKPNEDPAESQPAEDHLQIVYNECLAT
jgi:hypothetical protein